MAQDTLKAIILPFAQYVWGSSKSAEESVTLTPEFCISSLPFSIPPPCLPMLLTKLIGVAIICGAASNKAPVFLNILKSKSGYGFSMSSVYAESIMYSNSAFYGILKGNPITSFGENLVVAFQTLIMVLLLWKFKKDPSPPTSEKIMALVGYASYVFITFVMLPPSYQYLLHASNWFVLIFARGSQILSTYKIKHTGNQSIITMVMNFGGSAIRVPTTIKEVGWDFTLLSGFFISLFLNAILISQYFLYQSNTRKLFESLEAEKKTK